jgi:hypothetical protein
MLSTEQNATATQRTSNIISKLTYAAVLQLMLLGHSFIAR